MIGAPFSGLKSAKLSLKPVDSSSSQLIDASKNTKANQKINSLTLSP